MAIDHCREMAPAVPPAGYLCHIHRPPLITLEGTTPQPLRARTRRARAVMHSRALEPERPIHRFPIDHEPLAVSQQRSQVPVARGRILLNEPVQLGDYPPRQVWE